MKDILEALYQRKSTRVFTGEHIPESDVKAILNASFQAPTAGNQQLYTILRITDPELRHTVAELCDHQPFIERADLVLIYLADRDGYDFEKDTQAFCARKYTSDFSIEMTRSAEVYLQEFLHHES